MKKVILSAFILSGLFINRSFAQWAGAGSTGLTGSVYRTGNVGIGTSSDYVPHKLTVGVSDQNDGIWLGSLVARDIALLNNMTQGAWNPLTQAGDHMILWKTSTFDDPNGGGLVLGPWAGSNKGIRISPSGSVGIGTATTGNMKLAVAGKIGAQGVKVTLDASFPDYVFQPSYKLRPLSSLQEYINQNQHLPGIPSAEEVKKEGGIELGNMNIKLLEKIEELTLYILELNKKLEAQQKDIEQLKK